VTGEQLIHDLASRGVALELGATAPRATPAANLRRADVALLKEHRDEVIAALQRAELAAARRSALGGIDVSDEQVAALLAHDSRSQSVLRVAGERVAAAGADVRRFHTALASFAEAWRFAARRILPQLRSSDCVCAQCGTKDAAVFVELQGGPEDLRPWFLCARCLD